MVAERESAIFGAVDINFKRLPLNEALAVQLAEYIAGDPNYIPDTFFPRLREVYSEDEIVELVVDERGGRAR